MEKKEPKIRKRLRWQRKIVNAEDRNRKINGEKIR